MIVLLVIICVICNCKWIRCVDKVYVPC